MPGETTFESVAEWHFPNRVILAARQKTPLDKLIILIPLRCHWCKREMPAKKLMLGPQLQVVCIDQKKCTKIHKTVVPRPLREAVENGKKKKKAADGAKTGKKGSTGHTATAKSKSEEALCPASHKIDGKNRKCRRKPGHKGKHKDLKENRW